MNGSYLKEGCKMIRFLMGCFLGVFLASGANCLAAEAKPDSSAKSPADSSAVTASDSTATAEADSTEEEEGKTIESETESSKRFDGLFTVFQDTTDGSLKLLIEKDQVGREYVYFTQTVNGPTTAGHFRGSYRDNRVFSIRKHFNKIEFVSENTAFYFDKDHPLSRAANANVSNAILLAEEIVVEDDEVGVYLIDGGFFLTEALHQVKPSKNPKEKEPRFSLGSLSESKTKIRRIKNYPENTDLIVEYVYDSASPVIRGGSDVTDARSVSIVMRHSLIEMPKNDYVPRYDDPRIGYFTNARNGSDVDKRDPLSGYDPSVASGKEEPEGKTVEAGNAHHFLDREYDAEGDPKDREERSARVEQGVRIRRVQRRDRGKGSARRRRLGCGRYSLQRASLDVFAETSLRRLRSLLREPAYGRDPWRRHYARIHLRVDPPVV